MFPPQRILVAIDGSGAALQASRVAISLAVSYHATLLAVAVLGRERADRLVDQRDGGGAAARERRRVALEDALTHFVRSGEKAGVTVEPELRIHPDAEPYEIILEEVERWQADLLAVGRGSHDGIGRALLGSQTEHLLEFATLPVIVVPAESH
jgi:nucleotide-binding universal stress UspA family protein